MVSGAAKRRGDERREALRALAFSDPSRPDSIDAVLHDVDELLCYREDLGHQDRAHRYLAHRKVARDATDTAVQRAAADLVLRAAALGRDPVPPGAMAGIRRIADIAHEIDVTAYAVKRQLEA